MYFTLTIKKFMNLDFSDDQKYLQEEARKFLEKEGGLNGNARGCYEISLKGKR